MVLCSGCFDGLHAGHVAYLQAAHAFTTPDEPLFVAVASDVYILEQKRRKPHWSYWYRARTVTALRDVAMVVRHDSTGVGEIILGLRPRLFVKGDEWSGALPKSVVDACNRVGCDIVFVNSGVTQHTSDALPTHQ